MLNKSSVVAFAFAMFCASSLVRADLIPGVISNFQTGTDQGWSGGTLNILADSGPAGVGDYSAELSNGGVAGFFAMHDTGVAGAIEPSVDAIIADILRPQGEGAAEMRLVLFDDLGTRWTTTVSDLVDDDGLWHSYRFSIREADLTRVLGIGTYANLTANLDRIMFRYDPGAASSGGSALTGTMRFDNITAIPEPSAVILLGGVLSCALALRRRGKRPLAPKRRA